MEPRRDIMSLSILTLFSKLFKPNRCDHKATDYSEPIVLTEIIFNIFLSFY